MLGADAPVEQGSVVSLMCRTKGARPAAVITWYNGSRPFAEQPAGQVAIQASHFLNLSLSYIFYVFLLQFFVVFSSLKDPLDKCLKEAAPA